MQADHPCYKTLLFFTTFTRVLLKNKRDHACVVNRIINKCCIKNADGYIFRDNLNVIINGVMNENIQKRKIYSYDDIFHVVSTKIITDQSDPNMKYSLFRNRINDVRRIISTWKDDMTKEELIMHFPITSAFNISGKEDTFYRSDNDILKDPHDVSLHAMNALWMWSDVFEVIVFESCLMMLSPNTWKIMHQDFYNIMESLRNNYEINIFVMLCMMKFDACLYMFNFGRGIPASDRMKFYMHTPDINDRQLSSRFVFALCAHYHSKFRNGKDDPVTIMMHAVERKADCRCDFCNDLDSFRRGLFKTMPFESIFDLKHINKSVYFFTVVSNTFSLIRNFYGRNAISLMEMIFIGSIDNISTDFIYDHYDLAGVVMFDIKNFNLGHHWHENKIGKKPVLCVGSREHGLSILSKFGVNAPIICEIPILNEVSQMRNFFMYISAYFNDCFMKMKSLQRIRMWPNNDINRDEMIIFRYQHGIGIYFKSAFLFDTLFRAHNDAMIFSGKEIEMWHRSMIRLVDLTYSLDLSMNAYHILSPDTKEEKSLTKLQQRCAVSALNLLVDNFDNMMYGENENERAFVFSKIINRMTCEKIWYSIVLPYIIPDQYIIDSSTFNVIRFSNIGPNLISSIKCFFSDNVQIEKAIISYEAVKLIESRLSDLTYTYQFVDVLQEKYKTQTSELLSMMPLTKRFLFKANAYIIDHPDEEHVPLTGFEDSTYELCKMIYALCCMHEYFSDYDVVTLFMGLRLNEQVNVLEKKMIYKRKNHYDDSKDSLEKRFSLITDLFFDLIYASCFSTKVSFPERNILSCSSSDEIMKSEDDSIDDCVVHGTSQCISTVTFAQKRIERDNIYVGCSHRKLLTHSSTSSTGDHVDSDVKYRFPIPIYVSKNHVNSLPMLSDHLDRLMHEEPISISRFQKKEFLQYGIPERVADYLNNIDNCNKLIFYI